MNRRCLATAPPLFLKQLVLSAQFWIYFNLSIVQQTVIDCNGNLFGQSAAVLLGFFEHAGNWGHLAIVKRLRPLRAKLNPLISHCTYFHQMQAMIGCHKAQSATYLVCANGPSGFHKTPFVFLNRPSIKYTTAIPLKFHPTLFLQFTHTPCMICDLMPLICPHPKKPINSLTFKNRYPPTR